MEKSEYIILLERFLKGETTHDEERILVDWFKSDVSRDELRNYIQRKWEIASNSLFLRIWRSECSGKYKVVLRA